jgi:hypothetical protein
VQANLPRPTLCGMRLLTAAATGAVGLAAGLALGETESESRRKRPASAASAVAAAGMAVAAAIAGQRSRARLPLLAGAACAVASSAATLDGARAPWRRGGAVSGETQLIRLYRREARLSGVRSALQIATLASLLLAAALD